MCRGQRGEGERTLQVLAGQGMVEVYGVGLKDVVRVDIFVEFAGVERSVVVIANGEGDCVGSRRL